MKYNDLIISKQIDDNGQENIIIVQNDEMIYCGAINNKSDSSFVLNKILDFF